MLARLSVALAFTAADPTWQVLVNNFDTIILAVAFADTTNGLIPYDDNGSGPGVKTTTDGGKTWSHGTPTKYSSLLMDASMVKKNAVIGGTFDTQWSDDAGTSFNVTKGDKLVGQNCETVNGLQDENFFGITGGDIRGGNGVAISLDGGKSVKFYNITNAQTLARYGAFPTRTTWYVSAGMFPSQTSSEGPKRTRLMRRISSRLSVHADLKTGHRSVKLSKASEMSTPSNGDWSGEILKTSDAGKTWESQYFTTDFYFNAIDCQDETHCCAVGESDEGAAPGARIWCTSDGKTWKQAYFAAGKEQSLLALKHVPGKDGGWYAGGGALVSQFNITGHFPHSTDGGNTWNVETLKKVYVTDIAMVDGSHGWATTIEEDEQCGLAVWKA
jgi:photosystem II stability/assembly factor-like uncharacterized protein